jgi:hypothetical protein
MTLSDDAELDEAEESKSPAKTGLWLSYKKKAKYILENI